jgi:hypothetical protein
LRCWGKEYRAWRFHSLSVLRKLFELTGRYKQTTFVTIKQKMSFLTAWQWKREHRPFKDRYEKPYIYPLNDKDKTITIRQDKRIASTIWDSVRDFTITIDCLEYSIK